MADEWERLAELVRARRLELGKTQAEIAAVAGTSERTLRLIEKAERSSYHPATLRAIGVALGWTPESIDLVLEGDQPVDANVVVGRAHAGSDADRLGRIERRLDHLAARDAERDEHEAEVWKVVRELQARWEWVQELLKAESRNPSPTQAFDADAIRERMESEQDQEWQERLAAVSQRPAAPGEDGAEKAG